MATAGSPRLRPQHQGRLLNFFMLGVIALNLKTSALNTRNGMRGHRGRFINSPLSAGGIEPNLPRRSDAGRRPTATRSPPTRDRRTSTARTRRARGGGRSAETRRADPGRCAIFRIFSRGVQRAAPRRGAGRDTRRTSQRVPGNRGNLVAPVVRESHGMLDGLERVTNL